MWDNTVKLPQHEYTHINDINIHMCKNKIVGPNFALKLWKRDSTANKSYTAVGIIVCLKSKKLGTV